MRLTLRASISLCFGALAMFACQSELLTLGTHPVEIDGGSGGEAIGGAPVGATGGGGSGTGGAGGTSGQGGSAIGGQAGNDDSGGAGASAGAAADAGAGAGAGGASGGGTIRIIDVSPIAELLTDEANEENPTLTADLLTIYYISNRSGNADVWTASRTSPTALWGTPVAVDAVNTDEVETSPAISPDGLTLWVGQELDDGLGGDDIWAYTRSSPTSDWSSAMNAAALNSNADDIPRAPGFRGLVMPMASRRDLDGLYHTYFAERAPGEATFGAPQLVSELVFDGRSTVDGFLSEDGLTFFFASSTASDASDLYVAMRTSTEAPFGAPVPLSDVNTPDGDERDPWLSPDGTTLFFAAYNDGDRDLFTAQVIWE